VLGVKGEIKSNLDSMPECSKSSTRGVLFVQPAKTTGLNAANAVVKTTENELFRKTSRISAYRTIS
jgi:hypothetical protein